MLRKLILSQLDGAKCSLCLKICQHGKRGAGKICKMKNYSVYHSFKHFAILHFTCHENVVSTLRYCDHVLWSLRYYII